MGKGREECVCVWGEIDASGCGLKVENSANKRRVLVGETIMFLTSPGAGFDVID